MNFTIEILHHYSPRGKVRGYKLHFIKSEMKIIYHFSSHLLNQFIELYDSGDGVMVGSDTRAKFYHEHVKFYTV